MIITQQDIIKHISDTHIEIDKLDVERLDITKRIHGLMDEIQDIENACRY